VKPAHLVTRQRLWQRDMNARGFCSQCASPAPDGVHCDACRRKQNERQFAASRMRRGVPLDWPKFLHYRGPRVRSDAGALDRHLSEMFGV
jgi:hypothetical protein